MSVLQPKLPQDGPATCFYADPAVVSIYNKEKNYFDLVLVAGWPLLTNDDDIRSYEEFLELVQTSCFDPDDIHGRNPSVYFYKPHHLHMTIATLYPLQQQEPHNSEQITKYFLHLTKRASERDTWPKHPLQLQIISTQLGSKAGILLWRELTGGLAKMRESLLAVEKEISEKLWEIHSIPEIVHTSYLRFSREPKTIGSTIQEQYLAKVVPAIEKIFSRVVIVPSVYLVCETTPYMHIPKDDDHILWTCDLDGC